MSLICVQLQQLAVMSVIQNKLPQPPNELSAKKITLVAFPFDLSYNILSDK
jgi:hypothetical protein